MLLHPKELGHLHTRDWEPVTISLQALSFVEKVELVQVYFTLCLRDQWSMWSLHWYPCGIEWITIHGHLDYLQKPPLGGRSNTKPREHGTSNVHDHWFILLYHVRGGPARIEIHWNRIWLRARSYLTSHEDPWPHYMILEVAWDGLWSLSFDLILIHQLILL